MVKKLFISSLFILATTFLADLYANPRDLYWYVWWFDIPMHFFGGIGVALLGLWFVMWIGLVPNREIHTWLCKRMQAAFPEGAPWWWSLSCAMLAVAFVALVWEQYESFSQSLSGLPLPPGYILDTIGDYVFAGFGGLTAWATFYAVQCGVWKGTRKVPMENPKQH
jgi:hypothetical protein